MTALYKYSVGQIEIIDEKAMHIICDKAHFHHCQMENSNKEKK